MLEETNCLMKILFLEKGLTPVKSEAANIQISKKDVIV